MRDQTIDNGSMGTLEPRRECAPSSSDPNPAKYDPAIWKPRQIRIGSTGLAVRGCP